MSDHNKDHNATDYITSWELEGPDNPNTGLTYSPERLAPWTRARDWSLAEYRADRDYRVESRKAEIKDQIEKRERERDIADDITRNGNPEEFCTNRADMERHFRGERDKASKELELLWATLEGLDAGRRQYFKERESDNPSRCHKMAIKRSTRIKRKKRKLEDILIKPLSTEAADYASDILEAYNRLNGRNIRGLKGEHNRLMEDEPWRSGGANSYDDRLRRLRDYVRWDRGKMESAINAFKRLKRAGLLPDRNRV